VYHHSWQKEGQKKWPRDYTRGLVTFTTAKVMVTGVATCYKVAAERTLELRRVLRNDANLIVGNLKETTFNMKAFSTDIWPKPQCTVAKEGHHGGVAGQNSDLAVIRRGDDGIDVALEEDLLWRDDRYVQHVVLRSGQTVGVFDNVVDATRHEERLLRILVEFTSDEPFEGRNRLFELDVFPFDAGELLSNRKRL
jgi:hypothetical protein